jgi:hypothetical protein
VLDCHPRLPMSPTGRPLRYSSRCPPEWPRPKLPSLRSQLRSPNSPWLSSRLYHNLSTISLRPLFPLPLSPHKQCFHRLTTRRPAHRVPLPLPLRPRRLTNPPPLRDKETRTTLQPSPNRSPRSQLLSLNYSDSSIPRFNPNRTMPCHDSHPARCLLRSTVVPASCPCQGDLSTQTTSFPGHSPLLDQPCRLREVLCSAHHPPLDRISPLDRVRTGQTSTAASRPP